MTVYTKPLPVTDAHSLPFWEAAHQGELRLPRCRSCGHHRTTFESTCPECLGQEFDWALLSGQGVIWSFCFFHKVYFSGFGPEAPYNVALVRLAEGPLLVTNIVDAPAGALAIGTPVQAVFDTVTPEVSLVKFRPVAATDR